MTDYTEYARTQVSRVEQAPARMHELAEQYAAEVRQVREDPHLTPRGRQERISELRGRAVEELQGLVHAQVGAGRPDAG
jgi:hypothetical protein